MQPMMVGGKASTIVFYVAIAALGAFLAMWLLDFAVVRMDWCAGVETECAREWISALSGWAAALGAGLTIFALYDQLAEQRKQTAFTLGDAPPTVDVLEADDEIFSVVVKIVNWNRRTLLVEAITSTDDPPLVLATQRVRIGTQELYNYDGDLPAYDPPIRVDGWVDRSAAPQIARITIRAFRHGTIDEVRRIHSSFTVHGLLLGEKYERIAISAGAPFRTI